jgi:hypothetical protein
LSCHYLINRKDLLFQLLNLFRTLGIVALNVVNIFLNIAERPERVDVKAQ